MLTVLIGEGPNDIGITALVFSSMDAALPRCKEILGEDVKCLQAEPPIYRWNFNDEISKQIAKETFVRYYGGCGECYSFILKEVEEGKPFACWNLD